MCVCFCISEEEAARKQPRKCSLWCGVACMSRSPMPMPMPMPMEEKEMSESKKRKIREEDRVNGATFEDDDDEEKKVEQFFALIRSIRQARDYLVNGSGAPPKKKLKSIPPWKPTFRREDFIPDTRLPKAPSMEAASSSASPSLSASASCDLKQESDHKESLDLKLSL